jgi:hypothetical protein
LSIIGSRRALQNYRVERVYRFKADGSSIDYSNPFYKVRPRGFNTVLFEVSKPAHCSASDFMRFMDAVDKLSQEARS